MDKLTTDDINEMRKVAVLSGDMDIVNLCDAYFELDKDFKKQYDTMMGYFGELLVLKNEITYLKGENEMLRRDNAGLTWENGMLKEKLAQ